MTREKKLDDILLFLLAIDLKELKNETISKPITIDFIGETLDDLEMLDWELKSLKDELLNEGLVNKQNKELRITQKGKKFITRERGFKHIEKVNSLDLAIKEKTFEQFKYHKIAFWISIIALIISIISLFR
ncbi:hypothetical protein [Flavobacterium psychraquaticum]|uniref:hypothetical protein n=1 Tax=Flavobacterium psychraquaticum TaxID=3103958 RepID=UPI002ACE5C6F|nr:hypothetical protein [Flavobacterium sp. LB-N7T]